MDDEKLKYQIGANIAAYRKQAGLTCLLYTSPSPRDRG